MDLPDRRQVCFALEDLLCFVRRQMQRRGNQASAYPTLFNLALFLRSLDGACRGKVGQPAIEDVQLIFGRIKEYDAHTDSLVNVENLPI